MDSRVYSLLFPHIADKARKLGVIGTAVSNVCIKVAGAVNYRFPSADEIQHDKASQYMEGLEIHIARLPK